MRAISGSRSRRATMKASSTDHPIADLLDPAAVPWQAVAPVGVEALAALVQRP